MVLNIKDLPEDYDRIENLCPYITSCKEKKYDICYNHAHILCDLFEDYYDEQRRYKNNNQNI